MASFATTIKPLKENSSTVVVQRNSTKENPRHCIIHDVIVERKHNDITPANIQIALNILNDKGIILDFLTKHHNDRTSFKYWAFICHLDLGNLLLAQNIGGEIFSKLNLMDPENKVYDLVRYRFEVVLRPTLFCFYYDIKNIIACEQLKWLRSLHCVKGWEKKSWALEAVIAALSDNLSHAFGCAEKIIQKGAGDFASHYGIPWCEILALKSPNQARIMADKHLSTNPNSEWALYLLALALQALGEMDQADKIAKKVLSINPCRIEMSRLLCRYYLGNGDIDQAIYSIRHGLDVQPNDKQMIELFLGTLVNHERIQDAKTAAVQVIRNNPSWGYPHRILSHVYEANGEVDMAILEAEKAVLLQPEDMTTHDNLISILIRNGRLDHAEACARKGMTEHPDQAWPHHQLSMVFEAAGSIEKARDEAEKAFEIQPEKRTFAAHLSSLLRKLGQYDRCRKFCLAELDKNMNQGWAWRELCYCADELGDRKQAVEYGAKAISVHPEHGEFQRYYITLREKARH